MLWLEGNFDGDPDIDPGDYNRLASNFDPIGSCGWNDGNSDGDNDIDLSDYNALASNFQPLGYGTAALPEPATALLALLLISVFGRLSKNCWGSST